MLMLSLEDITLVINDIVLNGIVNGIVNSILTVFFNEIITNDLCRSSSTEIRWLDRIFADSITIADMANDA